MFVGLHKLNEGLNKNTEISNQNLNILVEKVNKKS